MKRRDVLKQMGFATGYLVATPTIISLLQSCTSDVKTWIPEFLSHEHGIVLTNIVDIMLPKTDLPSATEMNVPQFIDKYIDEVLDEKKQGKVLTGFDNIIAILKNEGNEESVDKVSKDNYKSLLDKHLLVKGDIDKEREANLESLAMTKSEFLNSLKSLCITAYLTTEEIGEHVLKYDPIPTAYYCGNLQELTGGKSWSL
ncbi:gluconate 2-dehydrogenase subunit 3 family protein [Wocania ichthyoenteri]|uniref:gluconate 2-dehydrogenase subunit 3 family protein n=1 Tax=Wocania ichthyoenteri TaxID=1230531 RepID=UPI00053DC006|nr:gluconate 2-dehydrogenase subunit 3 family protein [Wocania ichthyoenteri]